MVSSSRNRGTVGAAAPGWRQNGAMMDQDGLRSEANETTPIFGAFRKGYDPDQVDRFVQDQQRRLDEALARASEAQRRLAAAVGQLRELHRRVTYLESEQHAAKPTAQVPAQPLDTLGERIQRILQEAWEGANALREAAETDAAEIRQRTLREAETVVASARRKAKDIEEEIERRRRTYLGRVEEERARTVAQITYLHDQRKIALADLMAVKEAIDSTVGEVSSLRPDISGEVDATPIGADPRDDEYSDTGSPHLTSLPPRDDVRLETSNMRTGERDAQPPTMPVFRLETQATEGNVPDTSDLVRSHRATMEKMRAPRSNIRPLGKFDARRPRTSVFDFDEEAPS